MESIRQNPETYSKAVACFVEVWRSMDDKDRLIWLQTKIEDNVAQRVTLITADQLDETMQAAENMDFVQFAEQHDYHDVVINGDEREVVMAQGPNKRMKLVDSTSVDPVTEFALHFPQ